MRHAAACFARGRTDWETPLEIFAPLDAEFNFTLDVCALSENAKCREWYGPGDNGLQMAWTGRCWMNPPYGPTIGLWIKKACESVMLDAECVVCLVPSRTDTSWWHDYIIPFAEVRHLRGRVKFVGARHSAPFPCSVVIFRKEGAK